MKPYRDLEGFLKNANSEALGYGEKANELAKQVEQTGVYPCKICNICEHPESCINVRCIAWYRWFQYHWRGFQKAAKEEKK